MSLLFARYRARFSRPILSALVTLAGMPGAHAEWSGKGEAGLVMARGNSDTDTGNAKLEFSYERNKWKHTFYGAGLYGTSNEIRSAERGEGRWQSAYTFSDGRFVFAGLRYERDHFSGFDYQGAVTVGLGYRFIDSESIKLTSTLGAGYRRLRPEQLIKDATGRVIQRITGERAEDVVANGGLVYEQRISASTKLLDKLLVESGADNTFVQNDFAVEVSMTKTFALSLGYGIRHNTEPPTGLARTDRLTTANLVYNF